MSIFSLFAVGEKPFFFHRSVIFTLCIAVVYLGVGVRYAYLCSLVGTPSFFRYYLSDYKTEIFLKSDYFWVTTLRFSIENGEFQQKHDLNLQFCLFEAIHCVLGSNNCLFTCHSTKEDNMNSSIEIDNWICLYFFYFGTGEKPFFSHRSMVSHLALLKSNQFLSDQYEIFGTLSWHMDKHYSMNNGFLDW